MHVQPQVGEKIWGPNLQGKVVSEPPGRECTPRKSNSPLIEEIKKVVNFFGVEKCTPDKILATPVSMFTNSSTLPMHVLDFQYVGLCRNQSAVKPLESRPNFLTF